ALGIAELGLGYSELGLPAVGDPTFPVVPEKLPLLGWFCSALLDGMGMLPDGCCMGPAPPEVVLALPETAFPFPVPELPAFAPAAPLAPPPAPPAPPAAWPNAC